MLPCDAGQTIKQTVLVCQPILFNSIFISTTYSASCNVSSAPLNSNPQSAPTSRIPRFIHTQKLSSPAFATICVATSCPWNLKLVLASPHSQPALWDTHNFQQLMADATKIQRLGSKAPDGRGKTRHGSLAAPTPLGFDRISSEVSGVRNHL